MVVVTMGEWYDVTLMGRMLFEKKNALWAVLSLASWGLHGASSSISCWNQNFINQSGCSRDTTSMVFLAC